MTRRVIMSSDGAGRRRVGFADADEEVKTVDADAAAVPASTPHKGILKHGASERKKFVALYCVERD